jgi:hypothetical protein
MVVHHADTHRYQPGQEDTVLRVLSSVRSDAGIYQVLHVPQADPATYQVRTMRVWALLHHLATTLTPAVRRWAGGGRSPVAAGEAGELLGNAHP